MEKTEIRNAIMRDLAANPLNDDAVQQLVEATAKWKYPVRKFNICTHGICIDLDYGGELAKLDMLDVVDFVPPSWSLRQIEIFPEGIKAPYNNRLRLGYNL